MDSYAGEGTMRLFSKLVPLIAVCAVLVLALLPAGAPANPVAGSISFVGNGSLLIDGTVDVTLKYSCLPPDGGEIGVTLDEGGTALGFGAFAPTTCDGRNHSVTVNVAPGPFTRGIATGNAFLFNGDSNVEAEASQRVTIR
jgi:hypothetical protein